MLLLFRCPTMGYPENPLIHSILIQTSSTLHGTPAKAFDYPLGNRTALEWVINQYCVKTDKRSGILNDPNRQENPQYIVKIIRKVITVSLGTVAIVQGLPVLTS